MVRFSLLATLLLLPGFASADTLRERMPAHPDGCLRIELDRGNVEVAVHEADDVRIEALARGVGASSVRFTAERDGRDVVLTGRSETWLALLKAPPRIVVRAWVPEGHELEIQTSGGSVGIEGAVRRAAARTSEAPIRVASVSGPVELETSGAPIVVDFDAAPSGRVEVRDGRIEVAFPASARAELDARSEDGAVHLPAAIAGGEQAPRFVGALNGGGGRLVLRSSGGDIRVRQRVALR